MNKAMRVLALGLVVTLAACGGGGDEGDQSLIASTTAPAGSFASPSTNGRAIIESFAYTNTGTEPMRVRLAGNGQIRADGVCDCYGALSYSIHGGALTYGDVDLTKATAAWVDPGLSLDVTIPAGATITAQAEMGYTAQTGASAINWSAFTMTLRKF